MKFMLLNGHGIRMNIDGAKFAVTKEYFEQTPHPTRIQSSL